MKIIEIRSTNGKVVPSPEEYVLDVSMVKLGDFILSSEGKIIARKNESSKRVRVFKSVANYLIFDHSTFFKHAKEEKSVYSVNVPTIYGPCKIQSISALTGNDSSVVEQFFDPRTCEDFIPTVFSNIESVKNVKGLSINNYRKYYLHKNDESYFLDELETNQKILYTPSSGKSLTHFLYIAYRMTFIEEATLSLDDTDFDFSKEITLEMKASAKDYFNDEKSFISLDSAENLNSETLFAEIKILLELIDEYWEKNLISATGWIDQAIELTKITALLEYFSYDQYVQLWEELKSDTSADGVKILNVYYKIAPLIGSEGSVLFVRKLIMENIVSTKDGDAMLSKLISTMRQPTMKVLKALKDVTSTNTELSLYAYTSALGTAYNTNPNSKVVQEMVSQTKKEISDKISENLKNSTATRVYIHALGNLRCVSLTEEKTRGFHWLSSISDDEILMRLILALEHSSNPTEIFEYMLQILRDVKKSSELKAVALITALKKVPSDEQFEVLARIMDAEINYELYNLFESSVRAFVKTKELPKSALLWLRNRESLSRSTAFAFESADDFPIGFSTGGYLLYNDQTRSLQQIYADIFLSYNGEPQKMFKVFVRVFDNEKTISLSDDDKLDEEEDKPDYEITLYKEDKVVLSLLEEFDYAAIFVHVMSLVTQFSLAPLNIHMDDVFNGLSLDYFFPTDNGKNAHIYFKIPTMASATVSSSDDDKSVFTNFIASLNFTAQSVTGMHFYHPHIQAFQGSRELSSLHFTSQIALKLLQDTDPVNATGSGMLMNFNFELSDVLTPLFGVRIKKDTVVFLNRLGNKPFVSNKGNTIPPHVTIDMGSNAKDLLLLHTDIGAKYHIKITDYFAPPNNKEFPETHLESWFKKPMSEMFKIDNGDFLVSLLSYWNWNFLAHSAYSYNIKETLEPCHVYPVRKYNVRLYVGKVEIIFMDKESKPLVNYMFRRNGIYTEFIRSGPGLESLGICFAEVEEEKDRSLYHIYYGTHSGKLIECPKDQFSMVIKTKSEFSEEQIKNHNNKGLTYLECTHQSPYLQFKNPTNNEMCAKAATTLKDLTVNVHYKNVPKEFKTIAHGFWMWFLATNNGVISENEHSMVSTDEFTLKGNYPLTSTDMKLDVLFPEETYSFTLNPDILSPDNIAISEWSHLTEYSAPPPHCTIVASKDKLESSRHYLHTETDVWTQYAKVKKVVVSVKKVWKNQLALKIDYFDQVITAYPNSNATAHDKYEITVGETVANNLPIWTTQRVRITRVLDTVFFSSDGMKKDENFIVGYNGQSVMIVGSKSGASRVGICFGKQGDDASKGGDDD
uniref:Uncharacterized protein n=1 Tax=Phlebotomus papatasi TaxID=29031 RepID=A0A1B0GLZ8_PHLPP